MVFVYHSIPPGRPLRSEPGNQEQASRFLKEAPSGLLVAGHGLYAWGEDLFQAQRHTEIIEFLLELSWRQHLLNRTL